MHAAASQQLPVEWCRADTLPQAPATGHLNWRRLAAPPRRLHHGATTTTLPRSTASPASRRVGAHVSVQCERARAAGRRGGRYHTGTGWGSRRAGRRRACEARCRQQRDPGGCRVSRAVGVVGQREGSGATAAPFSKSTRWRPPAAPAPTPTRRRRHLRCWCTTARRIRHRWRRNSSRPYNTRCQLHTGAWRSRDVWLRTVNLVTRLVTPRSALVTHSRSSHHI